MSFWDDDDYYGPQYLSEVARALDGHSERVTVKAFRYVRWDEGLHYCLAEQEAPTYGPTLSGYSERLPDWPICHLEDLYYKPELDRVRLKTHLLGPNHYIYNRRTIQGPRECAVTRLQYLRTFGPALNFGEAPDAFADEPGLNQGTLVPVPSWNDLFDELKKRAQARSSKDFTLRTFLSDNPQ